MILLLLLFCKESFLANSICQNPITILNENCIHIDLMAGIIIHTQCPTTHPFRVIILVKILCWDIRICCKRIFVKGFCFKLVVGAYNNNLGGSLGFAFQRNQEYTCSVYSWLGGKHWKLKCPSKSSRTKGITT